MTRSLAIAKPLKKYDKNKQWHTLSREEQSRYYEMARQQRQLHMQLYPNWTMRDSVASGAARKRRNKRDKAADGGINPRSNQNLSPSIFRNNFFLSPLPIFFLFHTQHNTNTCIYKLTHIYFEK